MILTHGASSLKIGGDIPTSITIGDHTYPVAKIGNRLWTTENLVAVATDLGITGSFYVAKPSSQSTYPGYYYGSNFKNGTNYKDANDTLFPFRLPKSSDWRDLFDAAANNSNPLNATGWANWPDATNTTGFSAIPCGSYNTNSGRASAGSQASFLSFEPNSEGSISGSYSLGIWITQNSYTPNITSPSSLGNTMGLLRVCADIPE